MESEHDPFIFAAETQDETDLFNAIHFDLTPADGTLQSDFCEPLSSDGRLAMTDWSNLQSTLTGISPFSSCSTSHEEPMAMFEQPFWSQQPQLSGVVPASGDINDEMFDTMLFSVPDAISTTNDNFHGLAENPESSPELAVRMTKQSLRALKDWKVQHGDTAKPTKQDISRLQKRTGLSPEQIQNWFTHSRRRNGTFGTAASHRQGGTLSTLSLELSATSTAQDIPARPPTPTVRDILYAPATPLGDMCPMERWENSPPEHEAALVSDIAKALSHSDIHYSKSRASASTRSASRGDSASTGSSFRDRHPDPSESSIDSDLPGSITWSDHSGQSTHSGKSSNTEYRRRARKRRTNPLLRGSNILRGDIPKTFQCTFCTDSFKTKYDWSRHEKSLHLALESWTCTPFGSIVREPDGSQLKCAYCNAPSPTEDHLQTHRNLACDERPVSERTYYRKDHLRQHLRLVHGCRFIPSMSKWKRTPEYVRSRCGFCDQQLTTWQGRIDHLASHFRDGHSMANWSGGWGFEPHISQLIENGMPPFLIHHERSTVSPFSGTISTSTKKQNQNSQERTTPGLEKIYSSQYTYPATQALSWYDCFESQLTSYINATLAEESRLPSNTEIQDQARRFVYDGDDPWHQTIADNTMWLEDFKERYAFVDTSNA
jgi:Homeobox KN domain/C2H2-type zinc finger